MVLVEAARQMIVAVSEEFSMTSFSSDPSFVWKSLSVTFERYAFPLPTQLDYEITERSSERKHRFAFSARITVQQRGQVPCRIETSYEIFDGRVMARLERRAASSGGEQEAQTKALAAASE
jgi:hypothetical protein